MGGGGQVVGGGGWLGGAEEDTNILVNQALYDTKEEVSWECVGL